MNPRPNRLNDPACAAHPCCDERPGWTGSRLFRAAAGRRLRALALRAILAAALLGGVLMTGERATAQSAVSGQNVARQVIASPGPGQSVDGACLASLGGQLLGSLGPGREALIQNNSALSDAEFCLALVGRCGIVGCEPNRQVSTAEGVTQSFFFSIVMQDELGAQGGLTQTNALSARPLADGAGVTVAVLDTGVGPHAGFGNALLPGFNFIDGTTDTSDVAVAGRPNAKLGHGTLMAGLIHLLAPGARILPVKVLDSEGLGSSWSIMLGVRYAMDRGAGVINLSVASPEPMSEVDDIIDLAKRAGIAVIVATGNGGVAEVGINRRTYPSSYAFAVGAVGGQDNRMPFSDFSDQLDLWAPGEATISFLPQDRYGVGNGTSFSAAWVSGAAALIKSKKPNADTLAIGTILKDTADRVVTNLGGCDRCTDSRLNIGEAVRRACPADLRGGERPGQPAEPDLAVTLEDLLYYIELFGAGERGADIDDGSGTGRLDGGVSIDDLLYFVERYAMGC